MISRIRRIPRYASQYWRAKVSDAMNVVYGLSNPRLRSILIKPLHQMFQMQYLIGEGREGRIYRVAGISKQTGQPMKAAFIGDWPIGQRNTLLFYQHLIFEEGTTTMEDCGPFLMFQLRKQAEALSEQADLIAADMMHIMTWQPSRGDWMAGPNGIRMVFDFQPGETWQAVCARIGNGNANLRRARNSGFRCRISHDEADFSDFYHAMHVPMVKKRYGDFGDILNEPGLRYVFNHGGFIRQILDESGKVVAASLECANNHVLYGLLNGVRDGDPSLVKQGALLAVYYHNMQWALENGMRRVDAGVCPSFTSSGLYQHKLGWRFEPELNYWRPHSILLWAPESAPSAVEWMKANPIVKRFARWGGDGIKGIYESTA